jgi:hypothetical protein
MWGNYYRFSDCVGVMYSGEYDVCDVTMSVYPHRAGLTNMPDHGGNRTYDLWNTIGRRFDSFGTPKVVGSIPTVARHIFQACPVRICTQSNVTNIIITDFRNFSWDSLVYLIFRLLYNRRHYYVDMSKYQMKK